jgi:uncharacterized protein (DUF433 family)
VTLDLTPVVSPLRLDKGGVVRVGRTRVTLDSVLRAYLDGESAEGVVERFPTLDLADVHATIAWFLRHRAEADEYLAQGRRALRAARADARRRAPSAALRARLIRRRRA